MISIQEIPRPARFSGPAARPRANRRGVVAPVAEDARDYAAYSRWMAPRTIGFWIGVGTRLATALKAARMRSGR